jgi:hypothetical protein
MIMWADHVEHDPAMLKTLPKDIVMTHWHYGSVPAANIQRSLDAGFEVVLAPAMGHWGNVIQPSLQNFNNMDAMLAAAGQLKGRGVLGLVNTWWTPWRWVRDAGMLAVAYTGRMTRTRKLAGKPAFARQFAAGYFGLKDPAAGKALWRVHELMLDTPELAALLPDSAADVFSAMTLAKNPPFDQRADQLAQAVETLRAAAPKVRRHKTQYAASVLAARVAAELADFGRVLLRFQHLAGRIEDCRDGCDSAEPISLARQGRKILRDLHARLSTLCRAVDREWNRTRFPDDPVKAARDPAGKPCGKDVLLGRLVRSRDYLAKALQQLDRDIRSNHLIPRWP